MKNTQKSRWKKKSVEKKVGEKKNWLKKKSVEKKVDRKKSR